jgi:hypothetical protein
MKKILALVAALGLTACQASVKAKTPAHVDVSKPEVVSVVEETVDQKISFDKLTITIPVGWIKLGVGENIAAYASSHKKFKVLMTKENCPDFTLCMVSVMHSMQEAEATIETIKVTTSPHGNEVLIVSFKDDIKIYSWFTISGDDVYMIACGGENGLPAQEICNSIHDSIIIK